MATMFKDPELALRLFKQAGMREFTEEDWKTFAGCDSETPMIGEVTHEGVKYTLIFDGSTLVFHVFDDNGDLVCWVPFQLSLGTED